MDFNAIELLILDVDGVLTNGQIVTTADGELEKVFYVQDGLAIKRWQAAGHKVALLTGRNSPAVAYRAKELGIEQVRQGVKNKIGVYQSWLTELGLSDNQVAYIGDDWPDLEVMQHVGLPIAVANAVPAVKRVAGYITRRQGGSGAVAETIELLLQKQTR